VGYWNTLPGHPGQVERDRLDTGTGHPEQNGAEQAEHPLLRGMDTPVLVYGAVLPLREMVKKGVPWG